MNPKEFPQFCGKITNVAGIAERDGITYTIVDYLAPGQSEGIESFADFPFGLKERETRIRIPMRLDFEVVHGSEVKARLIDASKEGKKMMIYELEIIKPGQDDCSGFKYQKYFITEED